MPGTGASQEAALPGMRSIILLTVRTAERPATVPAPVHHPCQSLVAGQADGAGVVVRPHGPGTVTEDQLSGLDVPGSYQEPPASLLCEDVVVHLQLLTVLLSKSLVSQSG